MSNDNPNGWRPGPGPYPYQAPQGGGAQQVPGQPRPPHAQQGPYGAPQAHGPYGAPQAHSPYGAPQAHGPYGAPQPQGPYGAPQPQGPYGAPQAQAAYGQAWGQAAYRQAPHAQHPGFWANQASWVLPERGDADRTKRMVGLALWIALMCVGLVLTLIEDVPLLLSGPRVLGAFAWAMLAAFPPLIVYLFVPTIIDRYDPEPPIYLLMAFLWGVFVAGSFAGHINSGAEGVAKMILGKQAGDTLGTIFIAPVDEEFWKGICVFGFFYFLRREFDGVVDGIIYATFCALGFAAIENVGYYVVPAAKGHLAEAFYYRGVLGPWGHPLFTSMTGIGLGLSRESTKPAVRFGAPLVGYFVACTLHGIWNLSCTMNLTDYVRWIYILFCFAFFGIIVALVLRKGRIIGRYLRDEVAMGTIGQEDLALILSPIGRLTCLVSWQGVTGRRFIGAAARLALCKWHTERAMQGQTQTVSADRILPLRKEVAQLRAQLYAMRARPA